MKIEQTSSIPAAGVQISGKTVDGEVLAPCVYVDCKAITFTGEMALAVRERRKTHTRRPCNATYKVTTDPAHIFGLTDETADMFPNPIGIDYKIGYGDMGQLFCDASKEAEVWQIYMQRRSPYKPGEIRWVRESGKIEDKYISASELYVQVEYDDGEISDWMPYPERLQWKPVVGHKIPNGIFKEAARTFIRIKDVRVERLCDISEEDARAEGIRQMSNGYWAGGPHTVKGTPKCFNTAREAFADLWDSIYADKRSFDANPWVWVPVFDVLENVEIGAKA